VVPIAAIYQAYLDTLVEHFAAEHLMRLKRTCRLASAQYPDGDVQQVRYLVLSTGNKSELSVGYCTLYGI